MKTIKELLPELTPTQRMELGDYIIHYNNEMLLDMGKKEEDGYLVNMYDSSSFDFITICAAKLFGNGI